MKQCKFIYIAGLPGFICGDAERVKPLPKCQFCHKRDGENQCDYPTGGPCTKCRGVGQRRMKKQELHFHATFQNTLDTSQDAHMVGVATEGLQALQASLKCHPCGGTGKAMCNRHFCGSHCGVRVSADEGYCPDHMARAGKTRPVVKEQCWWIEESKYDGKCLRQSCGNEIALGDRVLYFPERRRAMDSECGEEYLRVAVEPN